MKNYIKEMKNLGLLGIVLLAGCDTTGMNGVISGVGAAATQAAAGRGDHKQANRLAATTFAYGSLHQLDVARAGAARSEININNNYSSQPLALNEHVIQKGENLPMIAWRYKVKVPEIMQLNNIKSPNELRVGDRIAIPINRSIGYIERNAPGHERSNNSNEYFVKPGDTLSAIAVEYGTTFSALKKFNNLQGSKLVAGQRIIIPPAGFEYRDNNEKQK